MRVEYGSVEKDGSTDLDVDWLAEGWLALLHRWIHEAEESGIRALQGFAQRLKGYTVATA